MFGRIIGCLCSVLCGLPFLYISIYEKKSNEPISFWNGDTTLKSKLKNIEDYNSKMSILYRNYSISYFVSAILYVISPIFGTITLCMNCTLGIFIVYKYYKKYLNMY